MLENDGMKERSGSFKEKNQCNIYIDLNRCLIEINLERVKFLVIIAIIK